MDLRYPIHPRDYKEFSIQRLREEVLIENLMIPGETNLVYSLHDRMIAGGVVPEKSGIKLETYGQLKSDYFIKRREFGLINIGGKRRIKGDNETYSLNQLDCLYVGKGNNEIVFNSDGLENVARFYLISTPAHTSYPTKVCSKKDATIENLGSELACNERSIF